MTLELKVKRLTRFKERLQGLMGLETSRPVYLPNCASVHTFGMKNSLTLLWLGVDKTVIKIDSSVPPRRVKYCKEAQGVVEILNESTAENYKVGDHLRLKGQALVESAFVFPVLFLLLFGFLELGLMLQAQQRLTHTIHLAVQTGSLTNNDSKIRTILSESYELADLQISIKNHQAQTESEISASDRRYNDRLTLQVQHPYQLNIPFLDVTPFSLESTASSRVLCRNLITPYQCD